MLDLSQDICDLFDADRLTIYALSEDKTSIVSKIKTGLNSFKDLKLPISDQSIAGYVALSRQVVNVHDVYDEAELKSHSPGLHFLQGVDMRTGYRTKQMLVAPLVDVQTDELLGAVQLIDNRSGGPFSTTAEEGIKEFCATLAIAFTQRQKVQPAVRSKFDNLVSEAILSAPELELASRSARRSDATIIAAPSSTKNTEKKRDPEMHQTRKGKQWHFGMKLHIGVDSQSGLAHSAVVTSANVHDKHPLPDLLHGQEQRVYGDSAYASQKDLIHSKAPKAKDFTNCHTRKPSGEVDEVKRSKNRNKSRIRARVEHVFAVVKRLWGFTKVRYRGLAKNAGRAFAVLALANIYLSRNRLMAQVRP